MAQNGRTGVTILDLDALYGPPLILTLGGEDYRIPGEAFTMDAVTAIQHIMALGEKALETEDMDAQTEFMDRLRGEVEKVIALAKPKLTIGPMPPNAVSVIAGAIIRHGYGITEDDEALPPTTSNRAARRATPARPRARTSQTRT